LGEIKWYGAWRTYAFFPEVASLFNEQCLLDIAEFIHTEMRVRIESKLGIVTLPHINPCPRCGHEMIVDHPYPAPGGMERDEGHLCLNCGYETPICQRCGSEMTPFVKGGITMPTRPKIDRYVCKCGYEEKVVFEDKLTIWTEQGMRQ
jgi:hypothetical protein